MGKGYAIAANLPQVKAKLGGMKEK